MLLRTKNTIPQKQLNNKERLKNLERAFTISVQGWKEKKIYRHIMLVDDIYTTGSTIEACSKVLQASQMTKVSFVSLCIGKGY